MDLTVIVVSCNGREMTTACLESVFATVKKAVEVVLVDNGSSDGTADAAAAAFPQARLIRNAENRGFAAAVNQGLRTAKGRVVVLLNNDARPEAGALDGLVDFLDANAKAGMAGPQLVHEDGRPQNSYDNCPTLASSVMNKGLLRLAFPSRYPSKRQSHAEPVEVESLIGASLAVKREVVEKVGPLDEDYFLFLEETDWCLRARKAGYSVMFVPSLRVLHLQGRTREKIRARARVEYVRSLFTYFRKQAPSSHGSLRVLHFFKTGFEWIGALLGVVLTLFLWPRGRRRFAEISYLLLWQVLFCPASFGIAPATWPQASWRQAHV